MHRGITAILALTILTTPTWASQKGGRDAKLGVSHCDCPSHAITLPNDQRDRTSSAKPGGRLSPLDLLVLHNEQESKREGEGWGTVVGQGTHHEWFPFQTGTAASRDARFTRRYLRPPNLVGNEVWIRTTRYPRGLKKVTVRNSSGQPINWSLEEDAWILRGLLAAD